MGVYIILKMEHGGYKIIMDLGKEILKSIQILINKKLDNYRADRTYQSIIKDVTPKGYVVLDSSGGERTVKCCIPGVTLRKMQRVWMTEPCGKVGEMFIAGVV